MANANVPLNEIVSTIRNLSAAVRMLTDFVTTFESNQTSPKTTKQTKNVPPGQVPVSGWTDAASGFHLAEGTKLHRILNGRRVEVEATGGYLVLLETGERYSSLGSLNHKGLKRVGENGWLIWKLTKPDGTVVVLNNLRGPEQRKKRGKRSFA